MKHLAEKQTLLERLKPHLDQIQDAGEIAGEFDMKAYLDEMVVDPRKLECAPKGPPLMS